MLHSLQDTRHVRAPPRSRERERGDKSFGSSTHTSLPDTCEKCLALWENVIMPGLLEKKFRVYTEDLRLSYYTNYQKGPLPHEEEEALRYTAEDLVRERPFSLSLCRYARDSLSSQQKDSCAR